MTRSPVKFVLILLAVVGLFAVLDRFVLKGAAGDAVRQSVRAPASYLFEHLGILRSLADQIGTVSRLTRENTRLKEENQKFLADRALMEALAGENEFLREAAGLIRTLPQPPLEAGVFGASLGPAGYRVLLNKGAADGIMAGDVVVTGSRVLVGAVAEVWEHTARLSFLLDPDFSVTARVSGSDTTGVIKGGLQDDLVFDLIVQDDRISEGDTVVSSGNDRFPAGLLIGTVRHVVSGGSSVFKKVTVEPAVRNLGFGKVLVIQNR